MTARTQMRHEKEYGIAQSITNRRRGNALERGGVTREIEKERAHRLISIYHPQTSFDVVIHGEEDVLIFGSGTSKHHARRFLKTFSDRVTHLQSVVLLIDKCCELSLLVFVSGARDDGIVPCGAPMLHDECSAARFTKQRESH